METVNGLMAFNERRNDNEVILDNGAEISVIKDSNLLTNIKECPPIKVRGVNSADSCLILRQQGLFQNTMTVYYS